MGASGAGAGRYALHRPLKAPKSQLDHPGNSGSTPAGTLLAKPCLDTNPAFSASPNI